MFVSINETILIKIYLISTKANRNELKNKYIDWINDCTNMIALWLLLVAHETVWLGVYLVDLPF